MEPKQQDLRLAALARFALAITIFNLAGHFLLGFEQAWAHPLVALATGYVTEILLELLEARTEHRRPRFTGGVLKLVQFLLPAHISALAISMLLYPNARLMPIVFATAVAISSKYLFRLKVGGRYRHFLNPSNFGITVTLVLFHWVGIAPPYMFTENLSGVGDWILPLFLVCTGSFLNARFTKRLPLIGAWLGTFALQALVRGAITDAPPYAGLLPMTGLAFLLFTFYMVSDPSTTPSNPRSQMLFGAAVAATYGLLLANHVVFTLFFSLSIVCVGRGLALAVGEWLAQRRAATVSMPTTAGASAAAPAGAAPDVAA
jgi:enediyne biosynthesis protein E5